MELDLSKFIVRKGLLNNRGHMKAWKSVRVRCIVHEEIGGIKNASWEKFPGQHLQGRRVLASSIRRTLVLDLSQFIVRKGLFNNRGHRKGT